MSAEMPAQHASCVARLVIVPRHSTASLGRSRSRNPVARLSERADLGEPASRGPAKRLGRALVRV